MAEQDDYSLELLCRVRDALYRVCEDPTLDDARHVLNAADVAGIQRAVDRKQLQYERAQRYWVEAAQKALSGDAAHLRMRVDMALAGPIEMTEAS